MRETTSKKKVQVDAGELEELREMNKKYKEAKRKRALYAKKYKQTEKGKIASESNKFFAPLLEKDSLSISS